MATTVYIKTGTGTGAGTQADPYFYDQLATAETAAGSGGTILFTDGSYATKHFASSGVTYESENLHGASFTGVTKNFGAIGVSVTVRKMKFVFNTAERIDLYGQSSIIDQCHIKTTQSYLINVKETSTSCKITNCLLENVITSSATPGILGDSWNHLGEYNGNTYFVSGLLGLGVTNITFDGGGLTSCKNSIFMSDDTANSVIASAEDTSDGGTNCCFFQFGSGNASGGTNNVFTDPLFVDASNADFRLRPSSPCINAGTTS
tara:strand:- start:290 stop:1075 length:786 start_codon:yes stop_codon:yes gene_type:complete